ncbi:hypothetical protein H632_c319p2, partial [Helicosporidium sp. ATCC 50920]
IVCLQETKLLPGDITRDLAVVPGWEAFYCCTRTARPYSGVATYVKTEGISAASLLPYSVEEGLLREGATFSKACVESPPASHPSAPTPSDCEALRALHDEGRVLESDHGAFVLFNIYAPAVTSPDEEAAAARFALRLAFYAALTARWQALAARGRRVVVVGDFNICGDALDTCEPGYSVRDRPDRIWLRQLLGRPGATPQRSPSFVDAFRAFYPGRGEAFTCWRVTNSARTLNQGSRIDLTITHGLPYGERACAGWGNVAFACAKGEGDAAGGRAIVVRASDIAPHVLGSDHCPVWLELFSPAPGTIQGADSLHPRAARFVFASGQSTIRSCAPHTATPAERPLEPSQTTPGPATPAREGFDAEFWSREIEAQRVEAARKLAEDKSAWTAIRGRMAVPKCRHGEPAARKRTGKAGENFGACNFFQWLEKRATDSQGLKRARS